MDREEKEVKEETAVPKTDPEMETAAAGENAAEAAEETAESGNQAETAQAQDGQAESQDGTEPEESTGDAGQKAEKKGFFKKKEKDQRDQKIEELTDQLRRNMAEFDNGRAVPLRVRGRLLQRRRQADGAPQRLHHPAGPRR